MVMPVLVLLIVGMMDIGWLFYTESSLDAATNLGCRAGALIDPGVAEGNLAEVQDTTQEGLVAAMSEQGLGNCAEQCEATVSVFGETPGRTLSCVVTYEFRPIIGMTLGSLTLEATQVVRMEWQRR
jgi:Flp pilus assembly protein TadG